MKNMEGWKLDKAAKILLEKLNLNLGNGTQSLSPTDNTEFLKEMRKTLTKSRGLLIHYIDLSNLYEIEHNYGPVYYSQAVKTAVLAAKEYVQLFPSYINCRQIRLLLTDDIALFSALEEIPPLQELYDLDMKIRLHIHRKLEENFPMISHEYLVVHTGHFLSKENLGNIHKELFPALKYALKNAKNQEKSLNASMIAQFENILSEEKISHLYQPILSLRSGSLLGWEALARGPLNSYFYAPITLFPYAEETGTLLTLENISQRKALANAGELKAGQKLFLNINAQTAHTLEFTRENLLSVLEEKGLKPQNVVLELTERTSILNFQKFKKSLQNMRNLGFSLALDDTGAGYSSLQAVAELEPNYIKLDISIVRNIHKDPVKQALVDTFVTFAKKINCSLIAEGIETREELITLIKLGVHYGQGYLLGKPHFPASQVSPSITSLIRKFGKKNEEKLPHNTITIGSIVQPALMVAPETSVEEVLRYFQRDKNLEGIIVTKEMIPLGLVMRSHFFNFLSSRYGVALYYKKPVTVVMDHFPLMVEDETTLEKASQIATNRTQEKLYDHILVTKNGNILGIVSIRHLLEVITQSKIQMAQYANPLTGLPGNIRIQEELNKIISGDRTMEVTYADIDNFKQLNDTYGFEWGDEILLLLSKVLKHVVRKYGNDECFLGHIGGDDFILITPPQYSDLINTKIIKIMHKLKKDTVSTSLAVIAATPGRFKNHLELAEHAARAKKYAKSIKGSVFVKEGPTGQFCCFCQIVNACRDVPEP